jgi:hypothetical protein
VLANSSFKPFLQQHSEARHPTQINKPVDFFRRKLIKLKNDITNFIFTATSGEENALEASY